MPFVRSFAVALMLSAVPVISNAQTSKKTGKASYSHPAGKGTPADLSHHKDNSALVLRENTHNGPAADLNRIEQQSMHSQLTASKPARIRPSGLPKPGSTKTNASVPINFSGKSASRGLTTTRSTGKSSATAPTKPH